MKPKFVVALLCLFTCALAPAPATCAVKLTLTSQPVSVLMLSDLHFDPYRDPAKVSALRSASVMQWSKILNDPDSVTQVEDYAKLQTACHARGVDSSWTVVQSSLRAAHTQQPEPLFITVDGDLLTHNFDCRLKTLVPGVSPADVSAFAAKTIAFLALQFHDEFGSVPVYLSLGNNDSGCTNYHQSAHSPFLEQVNRSIASGFTRPGDMKEVIKAFSERGDYSVLLPKSMHRTRFIIVEDVFQSPGYGGCGTETAENAADAQNTWLREQLIAAKKEHQNVWVMAHIPPGVDTYASYHKFVKEPARLCSLQTPTMLLGSDELAKTLTAFAPIVKLALFAHTHMDEIKVLHNAEGQAIPGKLIPSISPVNGNTPAFLLAEVQPNTATMLDYTVFAASDVRASTWSEEYRFSTAYGMPDFSADSAAQIATRLAKDKASTDPMTQTYQRWFLTGDNGDFAKGLKAVWPGYACAVAEDGGPVFQQCMCPAGTAPAGTKAGQ